MTAEHPSPPEPLESALLKSLFPAAVGAAELRGAAARLAPWPGESAGLGRAVEKRVLEFGAGRACARSALRQLGFAPVAIPAGPGRAPRWPKGVVGSITHTAGYCAAVAAPAARFAGVGIDAEFVGAVGEDLWPRLFTAEELAALRRLGPGDRPKRAALLFCAKEAFYKCQYPSQRRWIDFHQANVEVGTAAGGAGSGEGPGEGGGEYRVCAAFPEQDALTLCAAGRYRVEAGLLVASAWLERS